MVEKIFRLAYSRRWIAFLVVAVAAVHALWLARTGPLLSSDSVTYARWADQLIAYGFNYGTFLEEEYFRIPLTFYVVWISVVAGAKLLAGPSWPVVIVVLNWLLVVVTSYVLLRRVRWITSSPLAMLVAAFLLATQLDILIFGSYALSDITFLALSTAVLALGMRAAGRGNQYGENVPPGVLWGGSLLVVMSLFLRPASPPLAAFWIFALLWPMLRLATRRVAWGVVLLVIVAILFHAALMQEPGRWPTDAMSVWIEQLSREYSEGRVVDARPSTYLHPPATILDFAVLTLVRWLYFFAPWLSDHSPLHKLANFAFFAPTYALAALAVYTAVTRQLNDRSREAIAPLLAFIGFFSLFHAMQQVDFDHRYRLPVLPALIMLASIGSTIVWTRVRRWPWVAEMRRRAPEGFQRSFRDAARQSTFIKIDQHLTPTRLPAR